jgi:hypothetical protein
MRVTTACPDLAAFGAIDKVGRFSRRCALLSYSEETGI